MSALLTFTIAMNLTAATPRASPLKGPPSESRPVRLPHAGRAGAPPPRAQEGAPTPRGGAEVKADLGRLFAACKAGRHAEAARYFIYRGPEKNREWLDVYRGGDPGERREVAQMCRPIVALLAQSERAEFARFSEEDEGEGRWRVWELIFHKGERRCAVRFGLLRARGRYAVGDVDGHLACLRAGK